MAFGPADLLTTLQDLPSPGSYLVAYSGGLDSHALLHAMASLRDKLGPLVRAIHIHHGLQEQADQWQLHCEATCAALDVPLVCEQLALQPAPGESIEAAAREARYAAIGRHLKQGEMLLTAQHLDDQAETLLLQLLRGAGVEGLAGMPLCREWHTGWQARPLLAVSREDLHAYALDHALHWVEDPSNQDQRFDRNYLRHTIMPALQARWPSASQTLARSASHIAAAAQLVRDTAQTDLQSCQAGHGGLSVSALLALPKVRRYGAIRAWLRGHQVSMPDRARLLEIDRSVLAASPEASPEVALAGAFVRRYRDQLWLLPAQLAGKSHGPVEWPDQASLLLPDGSRLIREVAEEGLPAHCWSQGRVEVRWRSEDFRCRPRGRQGSRSFKKLCQELGVPPWQRDQLPLVYVDDRPVAVADYCFCGELSATPGEPCYRLRWST